MGEPHEKSDSIMSFMHYDYHRIILRHETDQRR